MFGGLEEECRDKEARDQGGEGWERIIGRMAGGVFLDGEGGNDLS